MDSADGIPVPQCTTGAISLYSSVNGEGKTKRTLVQSWLQCVRKGVAASW